MASEVDRKLALYLIVRGRHLPQYLAKFSFDERFALVDALSNYCAETQRPLPAHFLAALVNDPESVYAGLDDLRKEVIFRILDAAAAMAQQVIAGWGDVVDKQPMASDTEVVKGQKDPVSKAEFN